MKLFYNIAISLYGLGIRLSSISNEKARKWVLGRRNFPSDLKESIRKKGNKPVIWFHCASLGEFEQGRPVLEAFRNKYPGWNIVLTFFSPSGYEIRKNYSHADIVTYLPLDTPSNAAMFIKLVNPQLAVFIKYEYWFNIMSQLGKRKIPVIFISAKFRESQYFFKKSAGWFRKQLSQANHFFVQDRLSEDLLKSIGIDQVTVSGDTRFDRVNSISGNARKYPEVESFKGNSRIFLAGSTWPEDEKLLKKLINNSHVDWKFIIAPHETHERHISNLIELLGDKTTILLSSTDKDPGEGKKILIIDSVGHLMHLYQYCHIAYIGGGFGVGIHNILEAATFGKPVIFGPNYQKFKEAKDLIDMEGAFSISDEESLQETVTRLETGNQIYDKASECSANYVKENCGATETILRHLESLGDDVSGKEL